MIHVHPLYSGASIAIPDNTLKSTISNESDSFNIFQDHFITNYMYEDLKCYWNTLITYMMNRGILGIVTQEQTSEMVLNLFSKSIN